MRGSASASTGGSASGGQADVMRTRTRMSQVATSGSHCAGVCWQACGRAACSSGVGCSAAGTVALAGAVSAGEDAGWLLQRHAPASTAVGRAAGSILAVVLSSSAGGGAVRLTAGHAACWTAAGRSVAGMPTVAARIAGSGDSGRLASRQPMSPGTVPMHSAAGTSASLLCCSAGRAAGCPASRHDAAPGSAPGRPGWSAGAVEPGSAGTSDRV